jgi:hypothetical protein
MNSRVLLNLGLAVLIAGLVLIAVFKPGREAPTPVPLTALGADAVKEIRVERKGREPILLTRHESGWRLSAPVAGRANRHNVESLLRLLGAPSAARVAAGEDLAPFGLAPPQGVVRFDQDEIELGSLHPMRDQVYVRYRNEVHLVAVHNQTAAGYSYSQFLDTRLFEETRKPVSFKLPGFALALHDGQWRRRPEIKDLPSDRINGFVREWQHASALNVERASNRPVLSTIEIGFERDGKSEKLTLGVVSREPELVLRRGDEGLDYHFPEDTGKRLLTLALTNPASAQKQAGDRSPR